MVYVGLPEGGRLFFTMISTVCAISDRAGVSAWMVSAFLRIARIVTGMDMHLDEEETNVMKTLTGEAQTKASKKNLPVNNFGDEIISTN